MNVFPALHGEAHIEASRTGSSGTHARTPDTSTPGPRHDDNERTQDTRRRGAFASRNAAPTGYRVAGWPVRSTAQTAGTRSGLLPDAYIGTPQGNLRSDERHRQMVVDESGARYVPIGDHFYAVRHDPANRTWRAIQLHDPAKPGIPVELTAAGWRRHARVGLRGGNPNDVRRSLESIRGDLLRAIDTTTAEEREALRMIDDLDHDRQRAEEQARHARERNEHPGLYEQLVDLTKGHISRTETTLREIRDVLNARIGALRDVERSLSQLPPPST